jgi:hypothetical protein
MAMPVCSRPGHRDHKVVKDGTYSSPPRQRYRCTGRDGSFHRFIPPLPRFVAPSSFGESRGNPSDMRMGAVAARGFSFSLADIARALAGVGAGMTYAEAADRARVASGRTRLSAGSGGALVAQWIDIFAPLLLASVQQPGWPDRVLLGHFTPGPGRNQRRPEPRIVCRVIIGVDSLAGIGVLGVHASRDHASSAWSNLGDAVSPGARPRTVYGRGDVRTVQAVKHLWLEPSDAAASFPEVINLQHDRPPTGATTELRRALTHAVARFDEVCRRLTEIFELRHYALGNPVRTNLALGLMKLHSNGVGERLIYDLLLDHASATGSDDPSH